MELFPALRLGFRNGWLPLLSFFLVFGFILLVFPRKDVARLYDRSGWSKAEKTVSHAIKILALIYFGLFIFSPLKTELPVFIVGITFFAIGQVGFVIALVNFRNVAEGQPATNGLYRVSRNPQWITMVLAMLGISLMIGSWTTFFLFVLTVILSHFRLLAEEKSCMALFGDSYRDYLESTARYFVFF